MSYQLLSGFFSSPGEFSDQLIHDVEKFIDQHLQEVQKRESNPLGLLQSLTFPSRFSDADRNRLNSGIAGAYLRNQIPVLGGDTSGGECFSMQITVLCGTNQNVSQP